MNHYTSIESSFSDWRSKTVCARTGHLACFFDSCRVAHEPGDFRTRCLKDSGTMIAETVRSDALLGGRSLVGGRYVRSVKGAGIDRVEAIPDQSVEPSTLWAMVAIGDAF